jgi:precorrin-8X/cobalt-precorrin-8 methylmutase
MSTGSEGLGILVISHGSPRHEVNEGFAAMVRRIAARLGAGEVLPAFFSIVRPNIQDQVAELASRGIRRIVLLPYFLYTGQHVRQDIPTLLVECREWFPDVTLELLPTLENDPAVEDVVVDRLAPLVGGPADGPADGAAIERRSYEIIDRQIAAWQGNDPARRSILRRIVHATADLSFARTLRVHPEAVTRGRDALARQKPVLCDVRMLQAGLTKIAGETHCAIDREEVVARAREAGCTRAAAAMEFFRPLLEGAIVAIGNAPTALWKVLEIVRAGGPRPALVVGLPVGFVGAKEAKQALLASDLCYITNVGPRGGSPVAAAALNALAAKPEKDEPHA